MDSLPPGITGFWSHGDSPPPETIERDFLSYCHSVALQLGGRIRSNTEPSPDCPRNFLVVSLEIATETLSILVNAHHPFLAVAETWNYKYMYPEFVDCPSVADEFRKIGCYNVLSLDELNERLSDIAVAGLPSAEREQVEHWKPKTIGEVMFNSWD